MLELDSFTLSPISSFFMLSLDLMKESFEKKKNTFVSLHHIEELHVSVIHTHFFLYHITTRPY